MRIVDIREQSIAISRYSDPRIPSGGLTTSLVAVLTDGNDTASRLNAEAVAGIFTAKQRPAWDPLIVHIAGLEEIDRIAVISGELRARVERLAAAFWP